jgi:hypothetical protein
VGGGGEPVGLIAEAELDLAEELPVGGVEEFLGHLLGGLLGQGAEAVAEGRQACGAVGGGGGHGGVPAKGPGGTNYKHDSQATPGGAIFHLLS